MLKTKLDPALLEVQPRGYCGTESEYAFVLLNPSAAAAFSHVALSSIHPHPVAASSSHRPDGFIVGGNPTSAPPGAAIAAIAAISASTLTRPRTRRARFPPRILFLAGNMETNSNRYGITVTTNFDLLNQKLLRFTRYSS